MVGGDVVAVGKGQLADMAVGCGGFQVRPDSAVVCIVVEGSPLLADGLPLLFTLIHGQLMHRAVTRTGGQDVADKAWLRESSHHSSSGSLYWS